MIQLKLINKLNKNKHGTVGFPIGNAKVKIADLESAIQHETPRSVDISQTLALVFESFDRTLKNIHLSVKIAK